MAASCPRGKILWVGNSSLFKRAVDCTLKYLFRALSCRERFNPAKSASLSASAITPFTYEFVLQTYQRCNENTQHDLDSRMSDVASRLCKSVVYLHLQILPSVMSRLVCLTLTGKHLYVCYYSVDRDYDDEHPTTKPCSSVCHTPCSTNNR